MSQINGASTTSELLPPGRPLLAAVLRSLPAGAMLVIMVRTSHCPKTGA